MNTRTSIALWMSALVASSLAFGCGDDGADGSGGAGAGAVDGPATSTATGTGTDATSTGTDAGSGGSGGSFEPPLGSYTVTWGPKTIEAGIDHTQCMNVRLGNPEQLRVGSIHNVLGGVSHHLIVYKVDDPEVEASTEPYDCDPFADTLNPDSGMPLMITQKQEETLELPQGVAFTLAPDQMLRLEMHYVNPGVESVEMSATSTMIPIAADAFEHEAGFLFAGSVDVDVPRNTEVTLGPAVVDMPPELEGKNFFGFTGHVHKLGTNVTVDMVGGDDRVPAYDVEGFLWSEPPTQYHAPPLVLPAGGGFELTCRWNNTTDEDVGFGEQANDEMCFFWAYYYPSEGSRVCATTEQFGGLDVCCPGSALCDQIFQ
jgi:hypothetical protein